MPWSGNPMYFMVMQMSSWLIKSIAYVDDYLANNIIKMLSSWYCRSTSQQSNHSGHLMSGSNSGCSLSDSISKTRMKALSFDLYCCLKLSRAIILCLLGHPCQIASLVVILATSGSGHEWNSGNAYSTRSGSQSRDILGWMTGYIPYLVQIQLSGIVEEYPGSVVMLFLEFYMCCCSSRNFFFGVHP